MADKSPGPTPAPTPHSAGAVAAADLPVGSFYVRLEDNGNGTLSIRLESGPAFTTVDVTPLYGIGVSALSVSAGHIPPTLPT